MQWTSALSVGVDKIDEQHKEIFAKTNILLDACRQGKGKQAVGGIIGFLSDYVVGHFSDEEKLMLQYNYPGYDSHKSQHEQFVKDFGHLKDRFESEGPSIQNVVLTNKTVVDWLMAHISNTDKKLGAFLKEQS
jgi:hemerythrin